MDDLGRKIDSDYFRACCKVAAANTKGKGRLTFLMHLSAWLHDRAVKGSFRPDGYGAELDLQYIDAIIKVAEEAKAGDYDPRAILMECLKDIDPKQ